MCRSCRMTAEEFALRDRLEASILAPRPRWTYLVDLFWLCAVCALVLPG